MLASRFFSYADMFVETAVRYRVTEAASAPENKKQAKSAVMYRVSEATQTPENKKQVKSAVMHRVSRRVTPPEKKKQAKSAVRYRVSEAASASESSGDSLNLYSAAYGWQQIDQIQSQSNDCSHGLCFYVIF